MPMFFFIPHDSFWKTELKEFVINWVMDIDHLTTGHIMSHVLDIALGMNVSS